jgi:hypothetical protein
MSPADYGRAVAAIATDFPAGAMVWHRSTAKRGLVIGYEVRHQGNSFVIVDYGAGANADYPMCLSLEPVSSGGDGEQWKEATE